MKRLLIFTVPCFQERYLSDFDRIDLISGTADLLGVDFDDVELEEEFIDDEEV